MSEKSVLEKHIDYDKENDRFSIRKAFDFVLGIAGLKLAKAEKSAAYSLTPQDVFIGVATATDAVTLTLDSVTDVLGKLFIVKDVDGWAQANNITIDAGTDDDGNQQTVEGNQQVKIDKNYGALILYAYEAGKYLIVGSYE